MAAGAGPRYNSSESTMKKTVFLTGPMVKVLAVFASIAGVGFLFYYLGGMPAPREANRVSSAMGEISLIKPDGWNAGPHYPGDKAQYSVVITTEPPKAIGIGPRLVAAKLNTPPSTQQLAAQGFVPGKFQDRDAMILSAKLKRDFFWRAIFERDGGWYEVVLRLDGEINVPSSSWWPYLNSFRAGNSTTQAASP